MCSGYGGFHYNFGFAGSPNGDANAGAGGSGRDFPSPINFGNWNNLSSPITTDGNDQFSAFLQQTNSGENGVDAPFSFVSFNYGGMFLISLVHILTNFSLLYKY